MRFAFTILLVGILFLSFVTVFHPIETCSAAGETLHVGIGQKYSNISDAINAANESDTIYVHSGIYSENLSIEKSISIISTGGSSATTIKNSNANLNTIEIKANNVTISGFTIRQIGNSYSCIILDSVSECMIKNNVIKNVNGANIAKGIYLISSDSNIIQDNTIENNHIGIYLESNSNSNIIKNNNIQNNIMYGMFVTVSPTGNMIYLNDFSDNSESNARDMGTNNWDYSSQGNYWDNYNDYDNDSNGKGDNPYVIEGGSNQDNYPLGDFLSVNPQPVAYIDSISPNPASQEDTINFNGHGSDDGTILAWEWTSDGTVIGTSEDFSTSSLSSGSHTISFRVQDNADNWSPHVERTLVINPPNQKPTASILDPTTAISEYYGENITFLGLGSDDGEVVEYSWRSDIDGVLSELIQFTKNNLIVGEHTIYFKVRDDHGEWSSEASTVVTILSNLSNNPPFADVGGPYSGYVNVSLSFDASGSYDPDEDNIVNYSWDFGDGTKGYGVTVDHTYTASGAYTVNLTIKDSQGEITTNVTSAAISIQSNGQNGNGEENGTTPGFEILFFMLAIALILITKKKRE